MAAALRLTVLVLAFAFALVIGPATALSGQMTTQRKALRLRLHRTEWLVIPPVYRQPVGTRAVDFAKRFIGVPYRWGGSSPSGFDCSGLVRYVYRRFGIDLPHSSYADYNLGRRVGRWALKPGDLVFFSGLGHVGLYVGKGRFIHAPHSGTRVQISRLRDWGASYDGARRLVHA
jgi:cell wall-associated NlpC family hydrolase